MTSRLVPWPRTALAVLAAAMAVVAVLGAIVHDDTTGNRYDDAVERRILAVVPHAALRLMLHLTDPPLVVAVLALIAFAGVLLRRWDVALLAVLVPSIATGLTEFVLKPLVNRAGFVAADGSVPALAYPSGHETGIASLVSVAALLLIGSRAPAAAKIVGASVLLAVLAAAAVALVGFHYHYATDTIGAAGVAITVTLVVGLALDRAFSRRRRAPVPVPG